MIETAVGVLRRRWWILVACLVVIPAAVYVQTVRQPKVYEASVVVEGRGKPFLQVGEVALLNPASPSFMEAVARTPRTTQETVRALGGRHGTTGPIATDLDPKTGWVTLTATGGDAEAVVAAANASATGLLRAVASERRRQVDSAIRQVEGRLGLLGTGDEPAPVQATLRELRAFRATPGEGVEVVQPASAAGATAPHPVRNTALAAILALLVAPALMLLGERLDRSVRTPEQLEDLAGAPLLGRLRRAGVRRKSRRDDSDDFTRLRDGLLHFDLGMPLRTVMVASPLTREDGPAVAHGLARAFAQTGRRVLLVDVDLRRGDLSQRLGAAARPGSSDVLAGRHADVPLVPVQDGEGELALLPRGSLVADGSEPLSDDAFRLLVERLSARFDLIVFSAPPLLLGSDALPMLRHVSGVVCVAPLGRTSQHAVQRMARLTAAAGGRMVGAVATGAGA